MPPLLVRPKDAHGGSRAGPRAVWYACIECDMVQIKHCTHRAPELTSKIALVWLEAMGPSRSLRVHTCRLAIDVGHTQNDYTQVTRSPCAVS